MPLYRITVKQTKLTNGQRIEKGMSVDVVSNNLSNPIVSDKNAVASAFMRLYGVDINKVGALNTAYLETERIG